VVRRALLAALALMLLVPVLAEAKTPLRKQEPGRVPSARLEATGSGGVTAAGRMTVTGTIPGKGTVLVLDRAGDAKAFVGGVPQPFTRSRVRVARVRSASGILYILGSNVTVRITGADLDIGILGYGRALLVGTGTYTLNQGAEQSWAPMWIRLAPPASSQRRRTRRCEECSSSAVPLH
jgi:hypothetical protein